MRRRDFIRTTAATSLLSLLPRTGLFAQGTSAAARPNVLYLFADQHNANVVSYAGNPNVHTPTLDALAASGTRFNRAYCPDGICCPSRTALMTGNYPRTFGVYEGHLGVFMGKPYEFETAVVSSFTSLASAFQGAGYYTFTTGKRHLLPKIDVGWNYTAGVLSKSQWPTEYKDDLNYLDWLDQKGLGALMKADDQIAGGQGAHPTPLGIALTGLPPEATMEAFTAQQTIQFLQSPQAKKQPFFAWSTFYRPHQPYTPLKKYADQIDFAALQLPETTWQNPQDLPPGLCNLRKNLKKPWDFGEVTEADYRLFLGYYSALVQEIDDHIRDILQVLEQQGLAENTIVIYGSDHGDFACNHGLVEKATGGHNYYEDTLRVPLIFRWPGKIPTGTVRQDLVEVVDLYPTLLGLCGIDPPKSHPLPGKNLSDTLLRSADVGRKYIVSENWFQATVITDNYKYGQWLDCIHPRSNRKAWTNLFMERSSDPHETKNLVHDPAFAAQQAELRGHLMEFVGNTDDSGRREAYATAGYPYAPV